jgi:hypothetical protein
VLREAAGQAVCETVFTTKNRAPVAFIVWYCHELLLILFRVSRAYAPTSKIVPTQPMTSVKISIVANLSVAPGGVLL